MLAFLYAYTHSADTFVTVNYFIGWTIVSIVITYIYFARIIGTRRKP